MFLNRNMLHRSSHQNTFECKCSLSNTTVLTGILFCTFLVLAGVRTAYWGIEPQTTGIIVLNARFNSVGQDSPNGIDNAKGIFAGSDIDRKVNLTLEPMVTTPMSLMDRCRKLMQDQPLNNVVHLNVAKQFKGTAVYSKSKLILCIPAKVGTSMNSEIRSGLNETSTANFRSTFDMDCLECDGSMGQTVKMVFAVVAVALVMGKL